MLTTILVDDDYPVIRYLTKAVSWDDLGIKVIGSYSNGLEAWEAMGNNPPDIIITDIGMPKMNGLEMLEKFMSVNPKVRSVVLSCHNEFKYAQQALKLSVQDYILKESLDEKQLQDILAKIVDELDHDKRKEADILSYKRKETINLTALKEKFLKDTLYQSSWTKESWLMNARSRGIEVDSNFYIPIVVAIDRLPIVSRDRKMNDYTMAFSVENVIHDLVDTSKWVTFRYNSQHLVILYRCSDPDKERQSVHYALREVMGAIRQYLKFTVTCIWGRAVSTPKMIQEVLLRILNEPAYRFYWKEAEIYRFEAMEFTEENMYLKYSHFLSSLHTNTVLNKPEIMRQEIKAWADEVRNVKYHPSKVKEFVLQLLIEMQMKVKATLQYDLLLDGEKLYDAVHEIETLYHMEEWMAAYLEELSQKLSMYTVRSKHQDIIKAQQYVITHITEKVSLEDIAGHLNLNASYFSRLFKKETNKNFIEYVNMVKLDKAKELLQYSKKSVEDISDYLGYANKSYFIKLFKREIGMKPSEYVKWQLEERISKIGE